MLVPDQGSNLRPLHWKLRVVTTGLPGSPETACLESLFLRFLEEVPSANTPTPPKAVCIYSFGIQEVFFGEISTIINCLQALVAVLSLQRCGREFSSPGLAAPSGMFSQQKARQTNIFCSFKTLQVWDFCLNRPFRKEPRLNPTEPSPPSRDFTNNSEPWYTRY